MFLKKLVIYLFTLEFHKMLDLEKAEKMVVPTREELISKEKKEKERKRMMEAEIREY